MGEIQKYKDVLPKEFQISKLNRELYNANNSVKIKDIADKNIVVKSIHLFINYTIMDRGINLEKDEIIYIKQRVTDDIINDFYMLTLEDIKLAFKLGVRNEFGDYFGINPVTMYSWLKSYKNDLVPKMYQEVIPLLPKVENNIIAEYDDKLFDLEFRDGICEIYFRMVVHAENDFNDIGNAYYNFLKRINLIDFDLDYENSVLLKAKENLKRHLANKNYNLSKQGKDFHKINLSDAYDIIDNDLNKDYNTMIDIYKKKIILNDFLKEWAIHEVDLFELINNALKH